MLANDGMRTSSASSGPFRVARKAPRVSIAEPAAGELFTPGAPIVLCANASDREDGLLPGGVVTWTDSIGGILGNGLDIVARNLARGPHVITAETRDSDGNVASQSVSIWVGYGAVPAHDPAVKAAGQARPG